jgi:hypothetical protein
MTDATAQQQPDEQAGTQGETIGATGDAQDSTLEKDPADWVSGDEPMTGAQRSYLDTLAREAGETLPADLTKAEASQHIDRLSAASDRTDDA